MRSGDLLSEGIIYVREGGGGWCCSYGAGGGAGVEVGSVCMRTCVCVRVRDKTNPGQARPNPLYDI